MGGCTETGRGQELLLGYVDALIRGDETDMEAALVECPRDERRELAMAMQGAALVETVARGLRPIVSGRAKEKAWRSICGRVGLADECTQD